jgi:hypothetical protein
VSAGADPVIDVVVKAVAVSTVVLLVVNTAVNIVAVSLVVGA